MTTVVLDSYTLNPGDLSWDGLADFGEYAVHDRTPPRDVVGRAAGAEIALTNKTLMPREVIEQLPDLQYIGVLATGYNVVDVAAARDHGIPVTNVPTYGTLSVAQMVFAHILNLTQHVGHHAQTVRDGRWTESPDFCYWDYPLIELADQTMGIVGFGRIGRAVAKLADAFGMKVIAHDIADLTDVPSSVSVVELAALFRDSDVVTLHCPLTEDNVRFVDAGLLATMKPAAFLINTGRGPLVDDRALADALNDGRLAGAGLDVLTEEPPPADSPLLSAKNCFITPHISWATKSARRRLLDTAIDNIRAFVDGNPTNVVNP